MQLKLKPLSKSLYPVAGFLIKHNQVQLWFAKLQDLHLSLKDVEIYPIPDVTPNSVWGCLVLTTSKLNPHHVTQIEFCQKVSSYLYIPENSLLYPRLLADELDELFTRNPHIYHPKFGLVELEEKLNFSSLFILPEKIESTITKPQKGIYAPNDIKVFEVIPTKSEDVLKEMEEKMFPKKESKLDKPLNPVEKVKLGLYKQLFKKKPGTEKGKLGDFEKTGLLKALQKMFPNSERLNNASNQMQEDLEDLEKRNQREVDKLMNMMKDDPDEALKYAIPLDEHGTTRGGEFSGGFQLSKLWESLSLSGGMSSGNRNGGSVDLGDEFFRLRQQYEQTALNFIKQHKYDKAAFVYLKLLKDPNKAAQTLENGKFYKEAAAIYLEHLKNKHKAAECYQKGSMTREAIVLYKELDEYEKAGDLQTKIHQKVEAYVCYKVVLDKFLEKNNRVLASILCKNKMDNFVEGQQILLDGWKQNSDAYNCLAYYLADIPDEKVLLKTVEDIAANNIGEHRHHDFLKIANQLYESKEAIKTELREIAYEVIAKEMQYTPSIVNDLKLFNKDDKELVKDTIRYKKK